MPEAGNGDIRREQKSCVSFVEKTQGIALLLYPSPIILSLTSKVHTLSAHHLSNPSPP